MKSVGGVKAEKAGVLEPVVFTNGRPQPLAFFVKGVDSLDEFRAIVSKPKPSQGVWTKDKGWTQDEMSPAYIDSMKAYLQMRWDWQTIKTLEPSNIEWEKVNLGNPKTWKHVHEELREKLSENEYIIVMEKVEEANTLNREKLEENRETFFREREAQRRAATSQSGEVESTPSGEPASA